ncbi:hybrid sensor histidine kinase/response regulator LadS [Flavobacteriaceae bacterium MHTCC 0001]
MVKYIKCLGFWCVILLSTSVLAQSTIVLDDDVELNDIGEQTYFLEDAALNLTIEDILSKANDSFEPHSEETINFSSTASAYWLKFKISKVTAGDFYLNVGSAYIDAISLYEFDGNGHLVSERQTGDDLPFNTREIEVGSYLFKLDLDVGDTRTFYLRVKSDQPLFFPLRVGTLTNFAAHIHDLDFLQGIYFGFMLLVFLYNLFLYISTRENIYLYYIMYVVSITWFMASVFGYFFEYFWPNTPYINHIVVVSSGLTMITATLFTQCFLDIKNSSPRAYKVSIGFLAVGVLVCVLVLFGLKIEGLKLSQAGLLIMAIFFLVLGVRFKLRGYGPAKYYLIAWGCLIVGICFAILESLNLTFVMTYLNAMQIGSALEVLLLSFALGDRINMYKKQKENAQAEALLASKENEKLIQEQNILLEKRVDERTAMLAIRNKELVSINREKDTLVGIVAHDLRTPLGIIKSLVQLFNMTPTQLTEDQETYLTEIENSSDRLLDMIDRILNIHTLESKKIKLKPKVVNLVEVLGNVVQSFKMVSAEKNIELTFEPNVENCLHEIDKTCLIQVLENLISNALKFSEKGSKVVVRLTSKDMKIYIAVEDNGPGISEEDQKKLFGKFQKLTARPTAGESSTGIGLSIVKTYVEAMGAKIHCESQLGEGAKFIITFDDKQDAISMSV